MRVDQPESILILRPTNRVNIYRIEPGLGQLLRLIGQDTSLADAIEQTLAAHPSFNTEAALAFCFTQGSFTDLYSTP